MSSHPDYDDGDIADIVNLEPLELDPLELELAEWNVIRESLIEHARRLRWLSEKPGMPERRSVELATAAQRRFDLARKVVRMRRFCKEHGEDVEDEQ
jgi:hypothetical protein